MNSRELLKVTYRPTTLKRSESLVTITDLATNERDQYKPLRKVGAGTYGYVRSFTDGRNLIAVKAPKAEFTQGLSEESFTTSEQGIVTEFELLKQAYPNEKPYSLHHIHRKRGNSYDYDYRMVVPFVKGSRLDSFVANNIKHTKPLALLLLRTAQELLRLHDNGVIHGDVAGRNILVREVDGDYQVHFIDFGLAYHEGSKAIVGFTSVGDLAPERVDDKTLEGHSSQDVYMLAYLTNKLISGMGTKWAEYFNKKYPSLQKFVELGTKHDPKERPELHRLVYHLRYDLFWKNILPEHYEFCMALDEDDFEHARRMTESYRNLFTSKKLVPLLKFLIDSNLFNIADNLLQLKRRIPLQSIFKNISILHVCAANPDLDNDFFQSVLNYIHKKVPDVINELDESGQTMLHHIASNGRRDLLQTLLAHKPSFLTKNNEGRLAEKIAHPDVAPLIKLLTLIERQENAKQHSISMFSPAASQQLSAAKIIRDVVVNGEDPAPAMELYNNNHLPRELKNIYDDLIDKGYLPNPQSSPSFVSWLFGN